MIGGKLFIISAPSGTGKTTILKRVIDEIEGLSFSVSHTTRKPRTGENEGKDYFFVERDAFEAMQKRGEFLEYAEVHGNLYGTSRSAIDAFIQEGRDVILDIDVQGASQIREKNLPEAVFIFIAPPSLEELEKRLTGRGTDDAQVINTRLQNARLELADRDKYDYVIVNDVVENAVEVLRSIIIAERSGTKRSPSGKPLQHISQ